MTPFSSPGPWALSTGILVCYILIYAGTYIVIRTGICSGL